MNPPDFHLEDFWVTQFHMDFRANDNATDTRAMIETAADYDVGNHQSDPTRYRMTFRISAAPDEESAKTCNFLRVRAEVVAFMTVSGEHPQEKRDYIARVNGVHTLYGILRGMIATTTAMCPSGKFLLIPLDPRLVVETVERRKAENEGRPLDDLKEENPAAKKATAGK